MVENEENMKVDGNKEVDRMDAEDMDMRLFAQSFIEKLEEIRNQFEGVCVIDPENSSKFNSVVKDFEELVNEEEGQILGVECDPLIGTASISAEVQIIHLFDEDMERLKRIIQNVDVFYMYPRLEDKIYIGLTVKNVWHAVQTES